MDLDTKLELIQDNFKTLKSKSLQLGQKDVQFSIDQLASALKETTSSLKNTCQLMLELTDLDNDSLFSSDLTQMFPNLAEYMSRVTSE